MVFSVGALPGEFAQKYYKFDELSGSIDFETAWASAATGSERFFSHNTAKLKINSLSEEDQARATELLNKALDTLMRGDKFSDLPLREIDVIRVKGKTQPVRVFELGYGERTMPSLDDGLDAYRAQDWDRAQSTFERLGDDRAAQIYLERIRRLRTTPPPQNWDGVWIFDTK